MAKITSKSEEKIQKREMSNRFTDTEKWKKPWFRKLKPELKLFWIYMLDNCDHAGIWDVDIDLASFMIGSELNINEIKKDFKKQIIEINDHKWLIQDFIEWQYKCSASELNPSNKAHLSVIRILERQDIKGLFRGKEDCSEGVNSPLSRSTGVGEGVGVVKEKRTDNVLKREFEELWNRYPRKDGKKAAYKHFMASVKTLEDMEGIKQAHKNYISYLSENQIEIKYIKMGSTWFNNWGDWLNLQISDKESNLFSLEQ